ncbi:interleukin-27 receptor subunit alpha precursor, partial [Daubentonia madagascariensis]
MRGARVPRFWPRPPPRLRRLLLLLPPLLFALFHRTRPQGNPGPLQCYGVGPLGDLNCSWEPLGDLGAPSTLHLQSQKYHSNKTQTVAVPAGQSWVAIPREQLTMFDKLLVWGTKAGQPLWPPVSVNLETRMKPTAPWLGPDVDFSEDDPLEATVQWAPPTWPSHKVLICQFYYRRCQGVTWTLAPGPCVQVSYKVWFGVGEQEVSPEGIVPCCNFSIPTRAEWARVSAVNAASWDPLTNLSLVCLAPGFGPRGVEVSGIAGGTEMLVTWQQGPGEPQEHVVDWAQDGDTLEEFNWIRLPPGNLSALLP